MLFSLMYLVRVSISLRITLGGSSKWAVQPDTMALFGKQSIHTYIYLPSLFLYPWLKLYSWKLILAQMLMLLNTLVSVGLVKNFNRPFRLLINFKFK